MKMNETLDDPRLEAERLRREQYMKKFGMLPSRKDEDEILTKFNN